MISQRRAAILLLVLLAMLVVAAVVFALPARAAVVPAPSREATYEAWTYPIPVEPDTQSGAPFLDAEGRVFSVVRDDARLRVYRGDVLVLDEVEAYGAAFGQIRNDGCLYVSALRGEKPRREWRVYRVPTFACVRFLGPVGSLPMVVK